MNCIRHLFATGVALAIAASITTLSLATGTATAQAAPERDQAARTLMARRSSLQQSFLFEHIKARPPVGTSTDDWLRWMDEAERAFAKSIRPERRAGGVPGSRAESFSPYVWSWMPMLLRNGAPEDEILNRTQVERVLPSLLADLEAVVDDRESGACELLRIPDLGNGLSRAGLLDRVDRDILGRFRTAIGTFRARGSGTSRHLRSANAQLRGFARSIDVEFDLRASRLELAQARIAAMATPGDLPSGFPTMVERLARAYRAADRFGSAPAVLDLGLLSTTEGDWPARDLRALYEDCGGRTGTARFALARRAAPLLPTSARFDPGTLVDVETGQALDSDAFAGKSLVLDFTARGCGPCLEAVPKLQEFYEEHPETVILTVVVGPEEDRRIVRDAIRERGGRFPIVYDTAKSAELLGVYGYPSYVVVSPERHVLKPFGLRTEPTHSLDDVLGTLAPGG